MKVIAVIPVFGRLPLLKWTIKRLYEKNKVDLVICVGNTPVEKKLCEKHDAVFFHHPNNPLGMKWNYGFRKAMSYQPEAVLYVGSSDWLSDNWVDVIGKHLVSGHCDMIGTHDFRMLDISKRTGNFRACYWGGYEDARAGESIGIGRILTGEILEKISWKPFDDRKNNSLDFQMMERVKSVGAIINYEGAGIKSLSISCDQWDNKHKFQEHWDNKLKSERISSADIVAEFPEALQIFPELKPKYI